MERTDVGRREFTLRACLALLSGVAITISGCDDAPVGPTPQGDVDADISDRHGHVARVTRAQLDTGLAVVLNIRGEAGHGHSVALTREEVIAIADGRQVVKTSSTDWLHKHTVTFN